MSKHTLKVAHSLGTAKDEDVDAAEVVVVVVEEAEEEEEEEVTISIGAL